MNRSFVLAVALCLPLLAGRFPESDYTPFGYIDNPHHSAVRNRSGLIRSVPPIGFGFWARKMPFPYGDGVTRPVNYLSVLHLSVSVNGTTLHTSEDFVKNGITLVSRYHTKNAVSYDWELKGITFKATYFLASEHSLVCLFEARNPGGDERTFQLHATNVYGYPAERWWGADGVTAKFNNDADAAVSKIWAYGDVFVLSADRRSTAHWATAKDEEWNTSIRSGTRKDADAASVSFPGHMNSVTSYSITVPPNGGTSIAVVLTRDVNEQDALRNNRAAVNSARGELSRRITQDDEFYAHAPVLTGHWPVAWKHGWIYDLETLRMNIRPPLGMYKHPWDAMQVFSPRQVLGETMLDSMALSYADMDLAKTVIFGTFADSTGPHIPCTREDGSVNMICAEGSETGTAPIWGFPFHMVASIYERDPDDFWVKSLYPHLKNYLEWWIKNRTDKAGWFHSKCSWESGQDGSKRFAGAAENPGAVADFVRTVDIEAAMAEAFDVMARLAAPGGRSEDEAAWKALALRRYETTRSMFVDGWFRDFDARTNRPIMLKDYWDVMMLTPVALGIASPEQSAGVRNRIDYLHAFPNEWLVWPPVVFTYVEAAWNAGMRELAARTVAEIGTRMYTRLDVRRLRGIGKMETDLPAEFAYRLPGVAGEYWPLEDEAEYLGAENYGWGATLPTLVIRDLLGFREAGQAGKARFVLAPSLPTDWLTVGRKYGITNIRYRALVATISYESLGGGRLGVELVPTEPIKRSVTAREPSGSVVKTGTLAVGAPFRFEARNGNAYTIDLE